MPGDATAGRTGLSDEMTPGNIASLAQSPEVAFRVRFTDRTPQRQQMYWRAFVFRDFDGRTWSRSRYNFATTSTPSARLRGKPVRYEVTLEPGNGRRIFALDLPPVPPEIPGNPVRMSPDLEMLATHPVHNRIRYQAESYLSYSLSALGGLQDPQQWLRLPREGNPRARALGAQLASLTEPQRVASVLRTFRREPFSYTLNPPALGRDTVDEFLFSTRAGFCEHYAGAFVFLMRAAGVPARVVTGYQGGELNPVDRYLTVRQSDAHAWAEVWLGARGWVRVDPTAAVSPDRVERGLAAALPAPAPFGFEGLVPLLNMNDSDSLFSQLRFRLSAINNGWNQWVLNYTPERQRGAMDKLSSAFGNLRTVAAAIAIALLLYAAREIRRRRSIDPADALYSIMSRQLARRGFPRKPHEGPTAYASRLRDTAGDELGNVDAVIRFLSLYSDYKYGPGGRDAALIATMKSMLNESR
jgi:transglutaminase-like putative cysteine protease